MIDDGLFERFHAIGYSACTPILRFQWARLASVLGSLTYRGSYRLLARESCLHAALSMSRSGKCSTIWMPAFGV